jgi:hypothetical protein
MECRNCGRPLKGKPGYVYREDDLQAQVFQNHFGGYVCSRQCDEEVLFSMLSSMPGAGPCKSLPSHLRRDLKRWEQTK